MAKVQITEIVHDLDGVHADFDDGVKTLTGVLPHQLEKKNMWKAIGRHGQFFGTLKRMKDSKRLFDYTSSLKVKQSVLTGMPFIKGGADQKIEWAKRHLHQDIPVVVLPSKQKYLHAGPTKILIDDRNEMCVAWREAGGIAILHTDAESTIAQLSAFFE